MSSIAKSILLVDDNKKLLGALARTFKENSFDVHIAISSAEAMVILKHNKIDVLVSDNQMAGTNGTRLLAYVSKNYPDVLRFMLTGDISRSQATLLEREIGVCQLFEKPCNVEDILDAVINATTTAVGR